MIGRNLAFMVDEADDITEIQKDVEKWTGLCTFEFIPIMDRRKAVVVSEYT